jgi:hypothetical protein
MKPATIKIIIAAAVLFAFGADSWAHSPQARELCGAIQEINVKSHTLTILSPQRDTPFTVVWKLPTARL